MLLEDQSQPLPSLLRRRIVKKYWIRRATERALCVYVQHFTEEYKPAFTLTLIGTDGEDRSTLKSNCSNKHLKNARLCMQSSPITKRKNVMCPAGLLVDWIGHSTHYWPKGRSISSWRHVDRWAYSLSSINKEMPDTVVMSQPITITANGL